MNTQNSTLLHLILPLMTSLGVTGCGDDGSAMSDSNDPSTSSASGRTDDGSTDTGSATDPATETSADSDGSSDSTGETGEGDREHVPEEGVEFIEANGQQFGYFAEGEGPLVLLLHGFPDTPHTWDEIRPALAAQGYRVVTPFLRGYAPSSIPASDDYGSETLGRDVLALVDALGETQAHIVGHDWGAFAAYAAASLEPERVITLSTIAIPHPGFFVPDPGFFERATHFVYLAEDGAEALMREDDYAHVDELVERWSPTWAVPDGETESVKNAFAAPGSLNAALGYYRDGTPVPPPFLQEPIAVPSMTIAGIDDGVMLPDGFDQTAAGFTGPWMLHKFAGGHFVHRENPEEVIDALIEHLASAPG